jgi:hypothetical protein
MVPGSSKTGREHVPVPLHHFEHRCELAFENEEAFIAFSRIVLVGITDAIDEAFSGRESLFDTRGDKIRIELLQEEARVVPTGSFTPAGSRPD